MIIRSGLFPCPYLVGQTTLTYDVVQPGQHQRVTISESAGLPFFPLLRAECILFDIYLPFVHSFLPLINISFFVVVQSVGNQLETFQAEAVELRAAAAELKQLRAE